MPTPDSASAMGLATRIPSVQCSSSPQPPAAEGSLAGCATPTADGKWHSLQPVVQVAVDAAGAACSDARAEGFVEIGGAPGASAAPCLPPAASTPQTAPSTCSGAPSSVAHDLIEISPDVMNTSRDVIDLSIDEDTPAPAAPCARTGPQSSTLKPKQLHMTPAEAAPLTDARRVELLHEYAVEMCGIQAQIRGEAPLAAPPAPAATKSPFSKSQALPFIVGCGEPLSALTQQLQAAHVSVDVSQPLTEALLRNVVIDVATRRSYGVKDGRADAVLDALEDTTAEYLWKWEARDLKTMPKPFKPAATALKKRLAEAQARLNVLADACKALSAAPAGKTGSKRLAAAIARVAKVPRCTEGNTPAAAAARMPLAAVPYGAAPALPVDLAAEDPATLKLAAAEREAKLAAEKAAKSAEKAEKAAEREAKAAQKEAARSQKEAEKAAKTAQKAALPKGQKTLMCFVKQTPMKETTGVCCVANVGAGSAPQSGSAPTCTPVALPYHQFFSPPPADSCAAPLTAATARLDAALVAAKSASAAEAASWQRELLLRWKGLRPHNPRIFGLPPSWARAPDAEEVLPQKLLERYGEDSSLSGMKTWRRKLLWFPGDTRGVLKRPPFYGSWSKKSAEVGPRRPRLKDTSNDLDYNVMSDQEWEEEPEGGESLSDEEGQSEADPAEASEAADSFLVSDHHFSEDELQNTALDFQDMEEDAAESRPAVGEFGDQAARARQLAAQLQHRLEQHQRASKPLTLCCMDPGAPPIGDCTLLEAFAAQVLTSGISITMPEELQPAAALPDSTQPARPGSGVRTGGRPSARCKAEREALLPELVKFVTANGSQLRAKTQLRAAFLEQFPEASKNWVDTHLKDIVVHVNGALLIKKDVLAAHGAPIRRSMRAAGPW